MEPEITEIGVFHALYISCIEDAGSQTCNTNNTAITQFANQLAGS